MCHNRTIRWIYGIFPLRILNWLMKWNTIRKPINNNLKLFGESIQDYFFFFLQTHLHHYKDIVYCSSHPIIYVIMYIPLAPRNVDIFFFNCSNTIKHVFQFIVLSGFLLFLLTRFRIYLRFVSKKRTKECEKVLVCVVLFTFKDIKWQNRP